MEYLEFNDVKNKYHNFYYSKLKKMLKENLKDGFFLFVKNFPFKPEEDNQESNPQIFFTAGENLDSWNKINLSGLYGKENFLMGRCQKRKKKLTLSNFHKGKYLSNTNKAEFKKELKEHLSNTGIKVDVVSSTEVTESELNRVEDIVNEVEDVVNEVEDSSSEIPEIKKDFTLKDLEKFEDQLDEFLNKISRFQAN